jgi:streptogramin lyase
MGWFLSSLKSLRCPSRQSKCSPNRNRALILEDLEGRRLLPHATQSVVSLQTIPSSNMISGPDGNLWVGVNLGPAIAEIDRIGLDGSVTSFMLPGNAPDGFVINSLTTGPDGNVWFVADFNPTENNSQVVFGNVTPAGVVTEFPPIPAPAGQDARAFSITSGPGGDLWFVDNDQHESFIARATTAGAVTLFPAPSFNTKAQGTAISVAAGADGNLWFTETVGKHLVLGQMSPNGVATQVPFPDLEWGSVANGPSGSLIVTAQNKRGQNEVFQVSTAGAVTRLKIPAAISNTFYEYLGPADGSLWFTDEYSVVYGPITIGRIKASGAAKSFDLSTSFRGHVREVGSMAVGPDGNMYVLDSFAANAGGFDDATVYRLSPSKIPLVR